MTNLRWAVLASFLLGCGGNINAVPCEENSNCDLASGGQCLVASSGNQWCAYPDGECEGGYRYSDQSVGDGLAGQCIGSTQQDAGVDTDSSVDGPPADAAIPAFDVVYGDPWRFSVDDATNDGWFILVSNGTLDADISTIQVTSLSDTHPTAIVRVLVPQNTGVVPHGTAGGKLFVDNDTQYLAVIPETRTYTNLPLMRMTLLDSPDGEYDFNVSMMVSVNGIVFPLNFLVHRIPVDQGVYSAPDAPKRMTVYR